jgi:hypothetical protein
LNHEIVRGFKYNDKLLTPDGLQQVLLKSGDATKTKFVVKGKGDLLPMPTLPLVGFSRVPPGEPIRSAVENTTSCESSKTGGPNHLR